MTIPTLLKMLPPPLSETELPKGETMLMAQQPSSLPRIAGLGREAARHPGARIYLLREGLLRIIRRQDAAHPLTKYFVKSPQLFGELALMGQEKNTDIAEALSHCCISVFHAPTVKEYMIEHYDLSQYIWNLLARRFSVVRQHMNSFLETDLEERLLLFLTSYVHQINHSTDLPLQADNFLTYYDIAFHAKMSLPEVRKALQTLEDKEKIIYTNEKIKIWQPANGGFTDLTSG